MIPLVKGNARVRLALNIHTGGPITVVKEIIDIPPLAADETIKIFSKQSKAAMYLLSFYWSNLFHEFLQ